LPKLFVLEQPPFRPKETLGERGEIALAIREAVMLVMAEDIKMPLKWALLFTARVNKLF
jgi:hypothetical protein